MAYIGTRPTVGNFVKLDTITTSATATYNLLNGGVAYFPQSANNCFVSLNGVIQSPTTSFTISGSTIVFASTLSASDVIDFILVLGDVLNIGTPSDNTVTASKIADGVIGLGKLSATGTKDATTFLRGDNTFAVPAGSKFGTQLLHVTDEKSSSTHGGTSATSYTTRDLNTSVTNEISGASLSSNQITLPSGTYYINASAPAYGCNRHRIKLRNTTDSSDTILGSSEYTEVGSASSRSFVIGRFTIASQKVFEIQHRTEAVQSTTGLGVSADMGDTNIYTNVQIWKVA